MSPPELLVVHTCTLSLVQHSVFKYFLSEQICILVLMWLVVSISDREVGPTCTFHCVVIKIFILLYLQQVGTVCLIDIKTKDT